MSTRRTNVGLLALLLVAFITGALAFGIGTPWGVAAASLHGIAGFAIVALAPWKSMIVRRGLKKKQSHRLASVVFTVLVLAALAAGLFHSTGLLRSAGDITAMQVHVGAALLALPLAVWHVVVRRSRPRRVDFRRRHMLKAGAIVGGAGAAYLALEGASSWIGLPGGDRRFTGSYEQGSFQPAEMPITQWLNDKVPSIDPAGWRLKVKTSAAERELTYKELSGFKDSVRATLDCTGGWYSQQDWEGIRLDTLLGGASGRSILVTSATGYARRLPLWNADSVLLATRLGGKPLSEGHGFPARLVAPGRRGFWWVKWVTSIEVDDTPWLLQSPFPLT